jgi:hypothetical protein
MRFWEILTYNKAARPRRNSPSPQPEVVGVFDIEKDQGYESKRFKALPLCCFLKKGRFEFEHAVAQLVGALRYNPEGRGFVSQ